MLHAVLLSAALAAAAEANHCAEGACSVDCAPDSVECLSVNLLQTEVGLHEEIHGSDTNRKAYSKGSSAGESLGSIVDAATTKDGAENIRNLDQKKEKNKTTTASIVTLGGADAAKAKAYIEHLLIGPSYFSDTEVESAHAFPLPVGVDSMTCTRGQCVVDGPATGEALQRITKVDEVARSQPVCTDKICGHSYQIMYGTHLLPLMQASSGAKLFEIGLGCDMNYGPGASVALWKSLFPDADLWEAEYDAHCVEKSQAQGLLKGINVVTGDQGDSETVEDWVATSGGHFDVVIDDGGHHNKQIRTSFETLWPHVKPGGLYFMEDLMAGRVAAWRDVDDVVISDMVQAWVDQLLTQSPRDDMPLPAGVEAIFCQAEACMLRKARQ